MAKISLIVLLVFLGVIAAGPTEPEPRPETEDWWWQQHESFKQNTIDNGPNINVLFYGDSITQGWGGDGWETFNQYYAPLGTANYGIGGDQTQHLLYRILNGEVENINPKLCVLKIGTNNIGYPDNEIAYGVTAVVNTLKYKLPNIKILLLGILPRNDAATTARVDNVNNMISVLDDGSTVRFFNMRDVFYFGDGVFNYDLYTQDLLHLSAAGYSAWQQSMNDIFTEMLNS